MRTKTCATALTAFLIGALAACTTDVQPSPVTPGDTVSTSPAGTGTSPAAPGTDAYPQPTGTDTEGGQPSPPNTGAPATLTDTEGAHAFGEAVAVAQGITITVSDPKRLPDADTGQGPLPVVAVTVTLRNNSSGSVDAGAASVTAYASEYGYQANGVVPGQDYTGALTGVAPAGASRTAGYAFQIAKAADASRFDVQVVWAPSGSSDQLTTALWSGSVQ